MSRKHPMIPSHPNPFDALIPQGALGIPHMGPPQARALSINSMIKPCGDAVIVELPEYDGQLFVADNIMDRSQFGKVIAVGPGRITEYGATIKPPCRVGDRIFYMEAVGAPLELNGRKLHLVFTRNILGIFDDLPVKPTHEAVGASDPVSAILTLQND